jgi:two-component system nitrate/nitrite response regulator NarL
MKKITVLLADDHEIVLDGMLAFLEKESEVHVAGIAKDGAQALEILAREPVDVAILDISMPTLNGLEAARHIRRHFPQTKILLLSMHGEASFIVNAMRLGVHGYILKEKSKETLIGAIHAVHRGSRYWPPELLARMEDSSLLDEKADVELPELTERELEILRLIAKNPSLSAKEIGDQLHIAETTVSTHSRNMKQKLGLKKNTELVKYALEHNL